MADNDTPNQFNRAPESAPAPAQADMEKAATAPLSAPPDLTITAEQLPAGIKVGPWQTVEYFDKNNNMIAHFDSAIDGTQVSILSVDKEYAPITVKFTQHAAPVVEAAPTQALPSDITVVN